MMRIILSYLILCLLTSLSNSEHLHSLQWKQWAYTTGNDDGVHYMFSGGADEVYTFEDGPQYIQFKAETSSSSGFPKTYELPLTSACWPDNSFNIDTVLKCIGDSDSGWAGIYYKYNDDGSGNWDNWAVDYWIVLIGPTAEPVVAATPDPASDYLESLSWIRWGWTDRRPYYDFYYGVSHVFTFEPASTSIIFKTTGSNYEYTYEMNTSDWCWPSQNFNIDDTLRCTGLNYNSLGKGWAGLMYKRGASQNVYDWANHTAEFSLFIYGPTNKTSDQTSFEVLAQLAGSLDNVASRVGWYDYAGDRNEASSFQNRVSDWVIFYGGRDEGWQWNSDYILSEEGPKLEDIQSAVDFTQYELFSSNIHPTMRVYSFYTRSFEVYDKVGGFLSDESSRIGWYDHDSDMNGAAAFKNRDSGWVIFYDDVSNGWQWVSEYGGWNGDGLLIGKVPSAVDWTKLVGFSSSIYPFDLSASSPPFTILRGDESIRTGIYTYRKSYNGVAAYTNGNYDAGGSHDDDGWHIFYNGDHDGWQWNTEYSSNELDGKGPNLTIVSSAYDFVMYKGYVIETNDPTQAPTTPTTYPTLAPSNVPTFTVNPTLAPTKDPSIYPTHNPSKDPTRNPSIPPTVYPSIYPTRNPSNDPTQIPTETPTTPSPTDPGEILCGDTDIGMYNGGILEIEVQVRYEADIIFDASASEFSIVSIEASEKNNAVHIIASEGGQGDQNGGILRINGVESGDYIFKIEGDTKGQYSVYTSCLSLSSAPTNNPTLLATLSPTSAPIKVMDGQSILIQLIIKFSFGDGLGMDPITFLTQHKDELSEICIFSSGVDGIKCIMGEIMTGIERRRMLDDESVEFLATVDDSIHLNALKTAISSGSFADAFNGKLEDEYDDVEIEDDVQYEMKGIGDGDEYLQQESVSTKTDDESSKKNILVVVLICGIVVVLAIVGGVSLWCYKNINKHKHMQRVSVTEIDSDEDDNGGESMSLVSQ